MIRKSATGVIVALAVIWGGGTWYTGTQIQPGVEKFIKDFNDAKKKGEHAYDMTLSYQNFDKGFFNSRFQMQMTFDNGAPDLNIKPGQKVVFDVDVEHGPLPITMLMHGNVIPALAAAKVNLVNNELTQPLFIAAKNKSPVEATLRFAFGGSFSTTLDVAPAEYGKFSFGEGQFTFNGDGSLSWGISGCCFCLSRGAYGYIMGSVCRSFGGGISDCTEFNRSRFRWILGAGTGGRGVQIFIPS